MADIRYNAQRLLNGVIVLGILAMQHAGVSSEVYVDRSECFVL
jgi:hypothetical protein